MILKILCSIFTNRKITVLRSAFYLILSFFIAANCYAQQDLKLWYKQPATKWVEALPIGNGRLGAMIFGGIATDRIQFNEETLWTGYPRNYNKKSAYQYLDSIRNLLFAGRQKEAETLAGAEFMGVKSFEEDKSARVKKVTAILHQKNNPSQSFYNDQSWSTIQVPHYEGWETQGFEGMDGAVWFRKKFTLPAGWTNKDLKLDINKIADYDFTYVNGKLIGSQNNADARNYIIPASCLKTGENTIAILVLNFEKKGGILGYKDTSQQIGIYAVGASSKEKISLNGKWKYFIQSDEAPATGQFQAAYQPFGDVHLNFNIHHAQVKNYRRELDLSTAVATTSYHYNGVDYKREYIVSQPAQLIGVRLTASKRGHISFEAILNSPHKKSSVRQIDKNTIALSLQVKDGAVKGVSFLNIKIEGGSIIFHDNKLKVSGANAATIYIAAATNYKNYDDVSGDPLSSCRVAINNINNKTYQQIKNAHIKEYQSYFNTFSISFTSANNFQRISTDERLANFASSHDPSFVALYAQYGRYLLISSSRPGTRPANLQGIWNDLLSPPWGSKYTTNINLQMNYWPAELLNLSALHQPLFQMIKELSVTGRETAKQYYKAPGWVLHHNTDLWRGTAPINNANHGIWVTGGAWLCHHLWQHYLFTQNKNFLKDTAYPLMKSVAVFFNSFLIKDPASGYLISTPSNSPEQGGLVAGPAMDHQIIRSLFKNTIAAAHVLNIDFDFAKQLQTKHKQIAPDRIGRYGQLQEWMQDVDDTTNKHRHVSHLWAVYPGEEINENTTSLFDAARQSLRYRGDAATGWSLGWKINLWARFKDAEHTYHLLKMLLSPANGGAGSYPNLLDAHPPFQIDGNFGGAAGIGEMLVQSHVEYIDILPALPVALAGGEVTGICARGGFVLNMRWSNGKLNDLVVQSNAGQPLVLKYMGKEVMLNTTKNGVYQFNGLLERKY